MNYEDTTKDNLQLGTKCCGAGRKWHSGVPNYGSYWVCAKCNKPLGDITPTEPVEKCIECQFEKGHSQGCSEYIAGKPFESTEPVTEDLKEIIYRNYKNGDEIGLYTEIKDFIRQTRLDLLNEIEGEIESKYETPNYQNGGYYIESEKFNQGIKTAIEIVRERLTNI